MTKDLALSAKKGINKNRDKAAVFNLHIMDFCSIAIAFDHLFIEARHSYLFRSLTLSPFFIRIEARLRLYDWVPPELKNEKRTSLND